MRVDFQPLPHAFPFRFADGVVERTGPAEGRVRAAVTAAAAAVWRDFPPPRWRADRAVGPAPSGRRRAEWAGSGFLAGISDFTVQRRPCGDRLEVDVGLAGHLGATVKFEGIVLDGGGRHGRARHRDRPARGRVMEECGHVSGGTGLLGRRGWRSPVRPRELLRGGAAPLAAGYSVRVAESVEELEGRRPRKSPTS